MVRIPRLFKAGSVIGLWLLLLGVLSAPPVLADPLPGGTLDPTEIHKYVTPLVIPPVMKNDGTAENYEIAVRQFQQQILPAGQPSTTVWGYGPAADPVPAVAPVPSANSQFNFPAFTIETTADTEVRVRWLNELVAINPETGFPYAEGDTSRTFLPHLLPVDQTLHWANPPATDCRHGDSLRTDCATDNDAPYLGPVPIVTHLHGAHVDPHSDGYPEAWWLPAASNIDCNETADDDTGDTSDNYDCGGSIFDDAEGNLPSNSGYADYLYRNDQPATTLWYHDHTLGMTRLNVYAGPEGFYLIRGGQYDAPQVYGGGDAVLPGPAPEAGEDPNFDSDYRASIREIPIVIQDRSFNDTGEFFYPDNRAFFEGLNVPDETEQFPGEGELQIPFIPDQVSESDIAPTWNPEAFFNTMVVNGNTWPVLEVAPAAYRLRLLNGSNSRFLNLVLCEVSGDKKRIKIKKEYPIYQIGSDQGFLPKVVMTQTGFATELPGDGDMPEMMPASDPQQALLLGPAERADVIIDFSGIQNGKIIRLINTGPDSPFGGFPVEAADLADPETTGQVMQFVVRKEMLGASPYDGLTTPPQNLVLSAEPRLPSDSVVVTRQISLNEGESEKICVEEDEDGNLVAVFGSPDDSSGCPGDSEPFAPKEALLGTVDLTGSAPAGISLKWTAPAGFEKVVELQNGSTVNVHVTENPAVDTTEVWEIYNFTEDAHPIHLHLVRFQVLERTEFNGAPSPNGSQQPWETGYKDTVIAYPGEITRIKAMFDIEGLYVWHCHILEHEDNEMMRPYAVGLETVTP